MGWHVYDNLLAWCELMSHGARFYIPKYKVERSYLISIDRTFNIRRLMHGSSSSFL